MLLQLIPFKAAFFSSYLAVTCSFKAGNEKNTTRARNVMLIHAGPDQAINTDPDEFWTNLYQQERLGAKLLTVPVVS